MAASIRPPGSKSITNRALICAALASGSSQLAGALKSEDTEVMIAGLQSLGVTVEPDWSRMSIQVEGCRGNVPARSARMDLRNSGTSMRFLTALSALGHGQFELDGTPRMRERPIGDLASALGQLGAKVSCRDGCPPVLVRGSGLHGGTALVRCEASSQFLSALLMVLPYARQYSVLRAAGSVVSQPYVQLTCQVMREFGVDVTQMHEAAEYSVDPRHKYVGTNYVIEPDASAASYFWAAAAITGGSVRVEGLNENSFQGDVRFLQLLEEMGCEIESDETGATVYGRARYGVEANMNDISDTAQTLAVVALFAESPTTISGISHNRYKETDRIANLATELRKLGATVDVQDDGMQIVPGKTRPAIIETWNDHRMAMALALAGLRQPGVFIKNPECVDKTFPGYFSQLERICGRTTNRNGHIA
jgi:3-phosphoshikimate 1-carboxyvinyltransferase